MATAVRTFAVLELSQTAYDEIERKLLDAGYDHLFQQGPGSMIDMAGIAVVRSKPLDREHINREASEMLRSPPSLIARAFYDGLGDLGPVTPGTKLRIKLPAGYKLTSADTAWDLQTK